LNLRLANANASVKPTIPPPTMVMSCDLFIRLTMY
jgi:hypothetical protein